jgi:hypothetical protein
MIDADDFNINDFTFFLVTFVYVFWPMFGITIYSFWTNPAISALQNKRPSDAERAAQRLALQFNVWKQSYMKSIRRLWWWLWTVTSLLVVVGWNVFNFMNKRDRALVVNILVFATMFALKVMPTCIEFYKADGVRGQLAWPCVSIVFVMTLVVWLVLVLRSAWIFVGFWTPLPLALNCTSLLLWRAAARHTLIRSSRGGGAEMMEMGRSRSGGEGRSSSRRTALSDGD